MQTEGMTIAEATSCTFWGVGVAPNLAQQTKVSKFLGSNNMGKLQMALRQEASRDGVLNGNDEMPLSAKPSYTTHPLPLPHSTPPVVAKMSPVKEVIPTKITEPIEVAANPPVHTNSPKHDDVIDTQTIDSQENAVTQNIILAKVASSTGKSHSVKPKATRKPRVQLSVLKNMNTLDGYIARESSPATKRRMSSETTSPSSVHIAKSTRTDGGDEVS